MKNLGLALALLGFLVSSASTALYLTGHHDAKSVVGLGTSLAVLGMVLSTAANRRDGGKR